METGESRSFLCHRKLRPMTQKTLREKARSVTYAIFKKYIDKIPNKEYSTL